LRHRAQEHLRPRPQPGRLRRPLEVLKCWALPWGQRGYLEWSHAPSLPSFVKIFVVALSFLRVID
jgi:hypothetical protein